MFFHFGSLLDGGCSIITYFIFCFGWGFFLGGLGEGVLLLTLQVYLNTNYPSFYFLYF